MSENLPATAVAVTPVSCVDVSTERWQCIPGFEGLYEASDAGRVRRVGSSRPAFTPCTNSRGYKQLVLCKNGRQYTRKLHRLVAEAFLGACHGREVNHKDGDKNNNAASNLEWVTHRDNVRHAWRLGLHRPFYGEANYSAKLKVGDVISIRQRLGDGCRPAVLCAEYGVSKSCVSNIAIGKTWTANAMQIGGGL